MFQEGNSTFTSNNFPEEEPNQIIVQPKNDLIAFLSENNSLFELDLDTDKAIEKEVKKVPSFRPKKIPEPSTAQSKKIQKKRKRKPSALQQGCKCKHSNCLRLHCSCFKELGRCSPLCKCTNCLNTKDYSEAREFVIKRTKNIYKKAFEAKTVMVNG